MKKLSDLPIYFIIIGLILNIIFGLNAKVSFIELMIRSIVVIVLFAIMGYVLESALRSALLNIKESKKMKSNVQEEVTTSSSIDIRVESNDEDELLKTLSQSEDDKFVEINPEKFKQFMNKD